MKKDTSPSYKTDINPALKDKFYEAGLVELYCTCWF